MDRYLSRPDFARRLEWVDQNEPVSLADLKAQGRITFSNEDALLQSYIAAARDRCESELNRKIRRQRVELTYCAWGTGLRLDRLGHDIEIDSITYLDVNGDVQLLDAAAYRVKLAQLPVVLCTDGNDWPSLSQLRPEIVVTAQAGYLDADSVPPAIKQWIVAVASSLFRSRESHSDKTMNELEFIGGLLDEYRIQIL